MKSIAVIGAGAAGCFCAIELRRRLPDVRVTVYEAGARPLAKVAITGGGRCNFTNTFEHVGRLEEVYPRGAQVMRRALRVFSNEDVREWFRREGVPSVAQPDGCVFPRSQDAMQIVRTLERLMRQLGVELICGRRIGSISELDEDIVVVTAGGNSATTLRTLLPEDVAVTDTVPSLFTFKISDPGLRALTGTVVENASLSIAGTGFRSSGPLLLTDWGISGPATLRLSSYAARHLAENSWSATLLVNWLASAEAEVRQRLAGLSVANPHRQVSSTHPGELSERLWRHILDRAGLRPDIRWAEMGGKGTSRLANALTADSYQICGRAKFKEEFVTCGGVALSDVSISTLESKRHPGLYFAGEVLDIDAVTGGYNLQAAWSTAMVIAGAIAAI